MSVYFNFLIGLLQKDEVIPLINQEKNYSESNGNLFPLYIFLLSHQRHENITIFEVFPELLENVDYFQ